MGLQRTFDVSTIWCNQHAVDMMKRSTVSNSHGKHSITRAQQNPGKYCLASDIQILNGCSVTTMFLESNETFMLAKRSTVIVKSFVSIKCHIFISLTRKKKAQYKRKAEIQALFDLCLPSMKCASISYCETPVGVINADHLHQHLSHSFEIHLFFCLLGKKNPTEILSTMLHNTESINNQIYSETFYLNVH